MALDAQSNWNVEMAQPLKLALRPRATSPVPITDSESSYTPTPVREIPLPPEIIEQIILHISHTLEAQPSLYSCGLLSRLWYTISTPYLYARPILEGSNFDAFAATICPSKNARIRHSPLAALVRRLDMSNLVHNSTRSLTARLLGRLKPNLEEFVAPQASFAINSFAALSKCTELRELNLSLISASISHKDLFQTLAPLSKLETLFFPRTSTGLMHRQEEDYDWPPRLQALHLAGSIDDRFLVQQLVNVPSSLERLSIQRCPRIFGDALLQTLSFIGPRLKHLTIVHGMSKLHRGALDTIFLLCPSLLALRIDADYISDELFGLVPDDHPLRILDLDCSPQAEANVEISPGVLYDVVEHGKLQDLRRVMVSARLAWTATQSLRQDVQDLKEVLEDAEMERPLGKMAGVFFMHD